MTTEHDEEEDPTEYLFGDAALAKRRERFAALPALAEEDPATVAKRWQKHTRKRSKSSSPENAVRRHIEKHLDKLGALYRRVNAGSWQDADGRTIQGAPAGTSDYLALIPVRIGNVVIGVFAGIETKAPGNKPTESQSKFLDRVRRLGGIGIVAYTPLDIDDAISAYRSSLLTRVRAVAEP